LTKYFHLPINGKNSIGMEIYPQVSLQRSLQKRFLACSEIDVGTAL
jgi:hypothetical protein